MWEIYILYITGVIVGIVLCVVNGSNTFSVTDNGFERLWYCFHADCHTKGSTGIQLTKENSKVAFKEKIVKQETNE